MPPKKFLVTIEFGNRVRAARTELEYSQEELAEHAGLHRTYIGGVERGERNLSLRNIVKIALALQLDPAELTRGLDKIGPN